MRIQAKAMNIMFLQTQLSISSASCILDKYYIPEETIASSSLQHKRMILFPERYTVGICNLGRVSASDISNTTAEVDVSSWRESSSEQCSLKRWGACGSETPAWPLLHALVYSHWLSLGTTWMKILSVTT